jgi:hypothetical protein
MYQRSFLHPTGRHISAPGGDWAGLALQDFDGRHFHPEVHARHVAGSLRVPGHDQEAPQHHPNRRNHQQIHESEQS